MENKGLEALIGSLQTADGGMALTVRELIDSQFGIPLKHYCLQYLFGSTGLRYGGLYLTAGKPKSCKSPFVFDMARECCTAGGISMIYELEGKVSPTLLLGMLDDKPEWLENQQTSPFKILRGLTLDGASKHLIKSVLKVYKTKNIYNTPLFVDWDSISGAAMSDVVDKLEKDGVAGKGYYDKSHVMKYITENWSVLVGNLPVVFMGVLQEKEKAAQGGMPNAPAQKSYGGGDSQLFKAGTLISFSYSNLRDKPGKIVRINTALNGFADARKIEAEFVWNQFGDTDSESQGHRWLWAKASAKCLANPAIVGDLRDIVDVKMNDAGLVSCKQLGVDKVSPEEFEAALFAEENSKTLHNLYRYHKIDIIKPPEEYEAYIDKNKDRESNIKEAAKQAKAAEKQAKLEAEKAKEAAKQAKKEAKARKNNPLDELKRLAEEAKAKQTETL